MIEIPKITRIDDKRHIALLDTSSISFMQSLQVKGLQPELVLKDYDLILIPEWVFIEINDAPGRGNYVLSLISKGYPIYCIEEEAYSDLTNSEEGNLYQIVLASTRQLARVRGYLRRYVQTTDPSGSAYLFFMGGSTSGKRVNERSTMQMTARKK